MLWLLRILTKIPQKISNPQAERNSDSTTESVVIPWMTVPLSMLQFKFQIH